LVYVSGRHSEISSQIWNKINIFALNYIIGMPCIKCSTNKWKIGNGRCIYTSLQDCERALKAYYANEKKENEVKKK
jgi:hypothetical protein